MSQPPDPLSKVELRRDVLPNIALMWLANDALKRAESTTGNHQLYLCLASITFAALSLEAFLNVVGALAVKHWEDLESTASPAGKLAVIENLIGFRVDRTRIPFNAFRELFKFRNKIVHAKPDYMPIILPRVKDSPISTAKKQTIKVSAEIPLSKWEKKASIENARRLVTRAKQMIDIIAKEASIHLPTSEDHSITRVWVEGKEWVKTH